MEAVIDKKFQRKHNILALLKGWKVFEEEIKWLKDEIHIEEAKLLSKPVFTDKLQELNFLIAKKSVLNRILMIKESLEDELKDNSPTTALNSET